MCLPRTEWCSEKTGRETRRMADGRSDNHEPAHGTVGGGGAIGTVILSALERGERNRGWCVGVLPFCGRPAFVCLSCPF